MCLVGSLPVNRNSWFEGVNALVAELSGWEMAEMAEMQTRSYSVKLKALTRSWTAHTGCQGRRFLSSRLGDRDGAPPNVTVPSVACTAGVFDQPSGWQGDDGGGDFRNFIFLSRVNHDRPLHFRKNEVLDRSVKPASSEARIKEHPEQATTSRRLAA